MRGNDAFPPRIFPDDTGIKYKLVFQSRHKMYCLILYQQEIFGERR
jgi:hypothetical protein